MSKTLRKKVIIYTLSALIIVGLFILNSAFISAFNNKKHVESLSGKQMYFTEVGEGIDVSFLEKNDVENWNKIINDSTLVKSTEPNYKSVYYNFEIKNTTDSPVSDYKIRVDITSSAEKELNHIPALYVFKAWCGKVEFHQNVKTKEVVETLDLRNKPDKSTIKLEYWNDIVEDEYSIPLYSGDYFYYIPSKTEGDETPISVRSTSGKSTMILYESISGARPTYNVSSTYYVAKKNPTNNVKMDLSISNRGNTWGTIIDEYHKGITVDNYVGGTYDFEILNQSDERVRDYSIKISVDKTIYLSSGWNGSFEIHQDGVTYLIEDLRTYGSNPNDYTLKHLMINGENYIPVYEGDYFIYYPSDSKRDRERPLGNGEVAIPGMILYTGVDDNIMEIFNVEIDYYYGKEIVKSALFWILCVASLILIILVLIDVISALKIKKYKLQAEHDEAIIVESIKTFTGFIDAKDSYTNGHSNRVAHFTRLLAKKYGFSEEEQKRIYYIALMHDCGKIGIPDSILTKPSRLNDEEYAIIKKHTKVGNEILKDFKSIEGIREGVLYHHEKYDGSGYPEGLVGDDIPLTARLICVADAFDAMNTDRCYRPRLTKEAILAEFRRCQGKQFDPKICGYMIEMIESGEIKCGDIDKE